VSALELPITIRRPRPEDAAAIAVTMGDPEVMASLLQLPYVTEAHWRKRIDEMSAAPTTAELFIVAERDGKVVGNAGVHPPAAVRRAHAANIGMSVAREAQGQGVGKALMAAVVDWADNWARLLRLELTVYTDNPRAIALYDSFGFVREGTHRAYALRNGVFVDAHCMARLHPNPPQLPPTRQA
jgi:L-phenylalanine/L-methionine N-acetyltransferase